MEERIEHSINATMEQSIPHGRFVDIARLRVGNIKRLIWAMSVGMIAEVFMKIEEVGHKAGVEVLDVRLSSLPFNKIVPRFQEVLNRHHISKRMIELDSAHDEYKTKKLPPPRPIFSTHSPAMRDGV